MTAAALRTDRSEPIDVDADWFSVFDVFNGPFLNTELYDTAELVWYFGGWVLWIPVYWVVIARLRRGYVEIPAIAATGNIAWEFLWGWVYPQNMGWGLQLIYMGAFLMDVAILYGVFRFGKYQLENVEARKYWPVIIVTLLVVWTAYYVGFIERGDDLPLGSVTAYTVNLVMSLAYLWFGLTKPIAELSMIAAIFKGLGTGGVTVFVFLVYRDHSLVVTLAVLVSSLDASYIGLLMWRRRTEAGMTQPAVGVPG
ncbi:MAG: hypothetical protein ACJAXA_000855 [Candidatus Aldehydirespiratoraceae bacterium]|jgi:hypothetical protein